MIQIFLFLLIAAFAQASEEPDCGANTFLNEMGVCQVIDGGCEPDMYGNTYCVAEESIFMDGGRGVTIIILVIVIPIILFIIGIVIWKKNNYKKERK